MFTDEQVQALRGHCAIWDGRDPDHTHSTAGEREAAEQAVSVIDGMFREMHQLRTRLIGEMRMDDELTYAHADQLIARLRNERPVELPADVQARIDAHTVDLSGFGVS